MVKEKTKNLGRINICFDADVIARMREYNIIERDMGTAQAVLIALYNDEFEILDDFDDENKNKLFLVFLKHLQIRGLIEENREGSTNFTLTKRGSDLANFLLEKIDNSIVKQVKILDKETGEIIEQTEILSADEKLAKEFNQIFPTSNGDRQIRGGSANALRKLTLFKKNYPYSDDIILDAARLYVKEQEDSSEGHRFTINSTNFILRQDKVGRIINSDLSAWCEKVLDERKNPVLKFDTKSLDTL